MLRRSLLIPFRSLDVFMRITLPAAIIASVIAATVACVADPKLSGTIQAVTEIDELQINTFVRFGAAGPTLTSGANAPSASAAQGSLYLRTGTAQLYQNTDGSTGWSLVSLQERRTALGLLTYITIYSDWSPTGWATNDVIQAEGSDDSGTMITGLDSTGIAVGTRKKICNMGGNTDAANLIFTNQDTRSAAANRFLLPGADVNHGATMDADFVVGVMECVEVMYAQPEYSDPTFYAWVVSEGKHRFSSIAAQQLQIYPPLYTTAITGGSTVNNYDPTGTALYSCSPGSVSCYEGTGTNGRASSFSMIVMTTTNSSTVTITGLKYATDGHSEAMGPVKYLYNGGPATIILKNNSGSSDSDNQFNFSSSLSTEADVYLLPGTYAVALWHQRDTGKWIPLSRYDNNFSGKEVRTSAGVYSIGYNASEPAGAAWDVNSFFYNATATTVGAKVNTAQVMVQNPTAYDTTAAAVRNFGIHCGLAATRAAGANGVRNTCLYGSVSAGDTREALYTDSGDVVLNASSGLFDSRASSQYFRGRMYTNGTAPSLASGGGCGTTPAITGTNQAGTITVGSGGTTACTLTFNGGAWTTNTPHCTLTLGSSLGVPLYFSARSTTAFTFTTSTSADISGVVVIYNCWGQV